MQKKSTIKESYTDRMFRIINTVVILLVTVIIAYPLIYVLSASISHPSAVSRGEMWLWPVDITFNGFRAVLANESIWTGYRNTIIYTTLGTLLHLLFLLPGAYALSRKELIGKKYMLWFILFTMLFSGGMIPTYLLVNSLGMVNTIWAMIVPGAVGAWSILVSKTFFQSNIPEQLVESAKLDGASDFQIFLRVVLPLSVPLIAVMAMFRAFGIWNQYFNALIYLSDRGLFPLQLILREILVVHEMTASGGGDGGAGVTESLVQQIETAAQVKYAVIIVSAAPLLVIYPFLQRFFVKGVLVGSVKE